MKTNAISGASSADLLPVPVEMIERRIYLIRGQKVMLDSDLADLYQIETFNLNKAVKRNPDRFPKDFMFQLTGEEADALRFQIGMSKSSGRGGRRYLPYAFTELGVAMLSSVLNSERAVHMNIAIMRAFVRMRELIATHKDLLEKITAMEKTYDARFRAIFAAIRKLMRQPRQPKTRPIGFTAERSK